MRDLLDEAVPQFGPGQVVEAVIDELRASERQGIEMIAVVEGKQASGLVSAGHLLTAPPDSPLSEVMAPPPDAVDPDTSVESAAARMVARDDPAILVSDEEGRLVGLVSPKRLNRVLIEEHEEDMARLGGYQASSRNALEAAEEPLKQRLLHRLPWLIVGLAGAMASVVIVGSFEEQLDRVVLLAFFVPAVVYLADSVGTQTETLVIRALAADARLPGVVRREILTGLLLGVVVALMFFPFAYFGWGQADVALAVSLSLFCSCSIATAVAMVLPFALRGLGYDPAFGSGPLATVIQDLLSILIYFAIGVPLAA